MRNESAYFTHRTEQTLGFCLWLQIKQHRQSQSKRAGCFYPGVSGCCGEWRPGSRAQAGNTNPSLKAGSQHLSAQASSLHCGNWEDFGRLVCSKHGVNYLCVLASVLGQFIFNSLHHSSLLCSQRMKVRNCRCQNKNPICHLRPHNVQLLKNKYRLLPPLKLSPCCHVQHFSLLRLNFQ